MTDTRSLEQTSLEICPGIKRGSNLPRAFSRRITPPTGDLQGHRYSVSRRPASSIPTSRINRRAASGFSESESRLIESEERRFCMI
jgi:hypothetical protein